MSLLIKGIDMPERGIHCGAIVISETGNYLVVNSHPYNKCFALSEIPTPHGRLIDADELRTSIESMKAMESAMPAHTQQQIFDLIINLISNVATVIEAEE